MWLALPRFDESGSSTIPFLHRHTRLWHRLSSGLGYVGTCRIFTFEELTRGIQLTVFVRSKREHSNNQSHSMVRQFSPMHVHCFYQPQKANQMLRGTRVIKRPRERTTKVMMLVKAPPSQQSAPTSSSTSVIRMLANLWGSVIRQHLKHEHLPAIRRVHHFSSPHETQGVIGQEKIR